MKNKRLLKTIVGLAIAFAMTFTPFSGSYAMLVNPAGNGDGQVTETQATDATSEDAVSEETEPSQPEVTTEESEPAEQAEPEIEENVEPVEEVAEKAERTEYIWKDEKVKVTAVLSDAEAIPDDAELVAKAVTSKSDDYDYDAYMEALNKNSDSKYNGKNTLLYDVAFMKDGVEIQPESGTVSVTFEFLDKQLSKSIGAKKASDVNVIHLPLKNKIRDKYDTTADAKNIDAKDIVFEELTKKDNELAVSVKNEKVQFETSEFSVYAYTVDFEYTDPETGKVYTYNLEGAGSITIKELAIILGITTKADADEFVDNVENVKFSDENLVKVKKTLFRGWVLKSLAPFSSEELLTISMKDGTVIYVKVTDSQPAPTSSNLSNFLTSAEISAPKDPTTGKYKIVPGETYLIDLSFVESSTTFQFPNDGSAMTYQLPAGLEVIDHNGTFSIKVKDGGQTYTVRGNTYSVHNGVLTVHFDTSDENFPRMAAASNLQFGIEMEGGFREDIEVIEFNDEIIKELVVDKSNEVTASKSATVDTQHDKVNYTVSIVSKGRSTNVVVKDTISDPKGVLSLDRNSISATSSTGQPVSMSGTVSGNSFTYTIPEMKNGEIITFTYSADIDVSKIPSENGKYVVVGNNKIEVNSHDDPEPDTKNVDSVIDYTPSIKKDGSVVGPDGKTLTWTITANAAAKVSMAGGTITDTIRESSRQYMTYSGNGITVKLYNPDGTPAGTRIIPWNQLEVHTDSTWTYKIPEDDGVYKYVITYTTEVDTSSATTPVTVVENDVHTEHKDDHGSSNVPTDDEINLTKKGTNVDLENKEITWDVSFTVPEDGLTQAEVIDYYPFASVNGVNTYEAYKENTVHVDGLLPGETYDVFPDSTAKAVKIVFYRDSNKSQRGLNPGSSRTIHVTLKTEINEDWLEAAREDDYLKKHLNRVVFNDVITANDTVIVSEPTVDKTATVCGTRKVGNTDLPIYRYEITLTNVRQDDHVIRDFFDRELLEPYTPSPNDTWTDTVYGTNDIWYVYGGTINWQGVKGASPVTYVDTTDGITINTTASSMPHNGTGYYDKYKIVYCLTVKDAAAMNKILRRAASADNGKYSITNRVNWDDSWDGAEIEYEYPGLTKELLNPEDLRQEDDDIWVKFRITANAGAQMLNGGQPIELKDTVENLSIDVTSVKVEKEENGTLTDITAYVPHDMSGSTMTYQIPDSTKIIITYRARVTFPELHNGLNTIQFKNNVKMLGYEKEVHDEGWRTNTAEGTATVYAINLVKYQGGNLNKRLKGAVFALLDSNKDPVVDKNGQAVQYTTGDDGMIRVRGDQERFGWTLQPDTLYYLKEIKAPPGFMLLNSDYQFTISSDDSTDYTNYIYHNGDTMTAKNYRGTDVFVKKTWSDGYDNHESDTVTVKLQQKIGNGDWSDTIRWQNRNNNYAWEDVQKSIVLNKDNDWKGEFRRLPLDVPVGEIGEDFDEDSAEFESVEYRIVETKVNDYVIPYGPDGKPTDDSLYKIDITAVDGGTYIDETGAQVTIQSYNYTLNNTPVEEEGSLKIRKTVKENGQAPSDAAKAILAGDYTFTLYTDADCKTPYTVNGQPKTVTLTIPETGAAAESAEVTGLPAGDYWIKETNPTNGSSPVTNPVKVTVVAGKTGDEAVIAQFTNNLTGIGEIKVKKELNGREWTDNDRFTFTLSAANGTPMPGETSITITKADADQTKSFGEIKFTEAGTYTYTVTETEGSLGGVTYNVTPHTVTIEVVDDGNGNLVAKNGDSLIKAVTITNTYKAKGTAEVEVAKHLVGKTLEEGTFTFTISAVDNAPMNKADGTAIAARDLTVTNGADAVAVKFPKFHYTLENAGKTYIYKIVENAFNIPGVSRDTETGPDQIYAKVTVGTDKGDGTLTASTVKYYSDKACTKELQKSQFINKYDNKGSLKIRKTVKENGQAPSDAAKAILAGDYTFTLYTDAACEHPYTVNGQPKTVTLTIPETGAAAESAEVTGLPAGDYWIKETNPTNGSSPVINPVKVKVVAGKTGDEAVIAQFTNNLTGIGEIKVKKELNGRAWTDNDEFTFTLSAATGTPMPKITSITIKREDGDQTKSFGKIKFTEAGTYTYTVTETVGSIGGVIYEDTPHTVTIKVVDDGNGNLIADEGDSLIKTEKITNTYEAKGSAEVEVSKHLVGKTLEEGTFTFTISAIDNAPMNKADGTAIDASKLTVTNGADEVAVKFPAFHYTLKDAGKNYYYKIVEDDFNIPGVSRDTVNGPEQIYAKVTVGTDKGDGTLTASTVKYYSDKACTKELQKSQFINKYDATGSISLKGTKKFKYGEVDNETGAFKETFTFSVYKEDDFDSVNDRNSPAFILNMKDKAVSTASTAGIQVNNGKVSFDFDKDLEYTLADIVGGEKTAAGYWTKEFNYVVVEDIPATAVKKTVDGKTFYYDSSIDSSGKKRDIKYDATEHHVTIKVTDKGDGTLEVIKTNPEEEGPLTFDFENEKIYTKLLLTKDIDKYVTGDTKGELTNVTCVFKVKYKDPILGRTVTRTVSVQFDAQHVSADTAEVDKIPIEDPDKTFQVIEVYSIDYAGKVKQGKELKRVDQATGLPIWTVAFENEKEDNITGSGVINKVEKGDDNKFHITNRRDRTSEYPSPMPQGND